MRADVKDLIFPGNLQEIMNRVLAAERMSQVQLVEARTKAETQRLDAQSRLEMEKLQAEVEAAKKKMSAESEAEAQRIQTEADILSLRQRAQAAQAYTAHPALLRLRELDTLRELARTANARIYIGFDKHADRAINGADEK